MESIKNTIQKELCRALEIAGGKGVIVASGSSGPVPSTTVGSVSSSVSGAGPSDSLDMQI